jgi:DNA primase
VQDHRIEGVGEVDAEDLLALLGADNVHEVGHDEVGFSCLYVAGHYNGDRNPSAHINRDSLLWRCKGCGRAGNLLELVKTGLPHGTTHVEALRWLRESFGETSRKPVGGSLTADLLARLEKARYVPPAPRLPNEAETIGTEGIFRVDWCSDHPAADYMLGMRDFDPEVLEGWGIGYDAWTQRVAIPVRDETGILVGFKGRAIDDRQPKYSLLGDTEDRAPRYGVGYGFDMYDHRKVVFGLDRARGGDTLVLCEGELNVIACHAAGVMNAVAPGTTSITNAQLWLLRAHADKLVLFYDSDDAGQNAVWGYTDLGSGKFYPGLVEKISSYFRLYVCDDHEGDAASMAPEEIRSLVVGAHHWLGLAFSSEPAL